MCAQDDDVASRFVSHPEYLRGGISFDQTMFHENFRIRRAESQKPFSDRLQINCGWRYKHSFACNRREWLGNVQDD